jgi:hypothetical protein
LAATERSVAEAETGRANHTTFLQIPYDMRCGSTGRRHSLLGLVLAASLLLPGCALAQSASPRTSLDPRTLVGCYRMDGHLFALDSIPATFTLLPRVEGAWQAWSYVHYGESAYWRVLPGDMVEFVGENSLYGERFRGVRRGNGLAGRVEWWTAVPGDRPRAERSTAVREPCSVDGSLDEPPPNVRVLRDSLVSAMAAVVVEPLLPHARRGMPVGVRHRMVGLGLDSVGMLARIARSVSAHPELRPPAPDAAFAVRIHIDDYSLERDDASAVVFTSVCEDGPGNNLREERTRYGFVRSGSRWRFTGADPLERREGVCGPNHPRP